MMNTSKRPVTVFFQDCQTMDQLKAEYKRLAKKYHPDLGGDEKTMIQVNNDYDALSAWLPKVNAQGETYQPRERECPAAFRAAVMAVITLQGIMIELCGEWLWITGETRQHKDALKAAGYRFSGNKQAWYWHEEGYRKMGKKKFSLDEIRGMYGSQRVTMADREELPAAV
ncbi:MAG: J domain-containing protein [Clostridia bacterium]|nr:J domain-containing protein [Clostridia bacterium]